jgi:hypothetical protein
MYKGSPEYKQVQLYKNYSRFIPEQYWKDICPKPNQAVLDREEADQKKRRDEKINKKENKRVLIISV